MITRLLVPLFVLAFAAPALAAQDTAAAPAAPRPPKSSSTLITYVDIDRVGPSLGNAFDVVQLIRPRWLKAREMLVLPSSGADAQMQEIHVYLDDRDMGGLDFLRSIPAVQVYTLRYLSLTEVAVRFGPPRSGAGPGIVVTLKR